MAAGSESGVGMISNRRMYRGGLKKCVPNQLRRNASLKPSTMLPTGRPLVFVVTIADGLRTASTFLSSVRLISRFSATASMIQSASASSLRSSSKLPVLISLASEGSKKAAGFDFLAPSSPAATILSRSGLPSPGFAGEAPGGTMSSR